MIQCPLRLVGVPLPVEPAKLWSFLTNFIELTLANNECKIPFYQITKTKTNKQTGDDIMMMTTTMMLTLFDEGT